MINQSEIESKLTQKLMTFKNDPYGFVCFAYHWGQKQLKDEEGPDEWQKQFMEEIRFSLENDPKDNILKAVTSGHGPGKTCLTSWIIQWFLSTRRHPEIVVTANTKTQIDTKTWRELAKWHNMLINKHRFKWTATRYYNIEHYKTWYAAAIPWSENNPEAFAGTHEENVLILFDESSNIPPIIWENAMGAMTTAGSMFFVFGNPTRNTGKFKDCFNIGRSRWTNQTVDSRNAKKTNKKEIQSWIDEYGEDSDFVKIRVKGEFPTVSSAQLIAENLVEKSFAEKYSPTVYQHNPIILGADVARYGDDMSVICVRQGLQVKIFVKFREIDTVNFAEAIIKCYIEYKVDICMVDVVGVGAGTVDTLIKLGYPVMEVNAGNEPSDKTKFSNKRAEMWWLTRTWLEGGGSLPPDDALKTDLTGLEYGYTQKGQKIQVEKKEHMKERGLASPDIAESLIHTFAYEVNTVPRSLGGGSEDDNEYRVKRNRHTGY